MLASLKYVGRSKGDNLNSLSKHHFIHVQNVLNMTATNFDTFRLSPDYVMPNSWKDSRHIIDDFSCYKILCLHLNEHLRQKMDWTWRSNSLAPLLTWPDTNGFSFLGTHVNLVFRDSRGDTTRYCGMNISSSWSHPWYAWNLSKSSTWLNQAIYKMYLSWWLPYRAPFVSE